MFLLRFWDNLSRSGYFFTPCNGAEPGVDERALHQSRLTDSTLAPCPPLVTTRGQLFKLTLPVRAPQGHRAAMLGPGDRGEGGGMPCKGKTLLQPAWLGNKNWVASSLCNGTPFYWTQKCIQTILGSSLHSEKKLIRKCWSKITVNIIWLLDSSVLKNMIGRHLTWNIYFLVDFCYLHSFKLLSYNFNS